MTIDKIKHYMGEPLFNHIGSLNEKRLQSMRVALVQDMELLTPGTMPYFYKKIELELIDKRLG